MNIFKSKDMLEISNTIIEPDSWGCLVEGYFWSVKIMLQHILEADSFQNRWVIYPILYTVRHYYELSLKDILANLGYISNEKLLIETHNLDELLDIFEKHSKKYYHENKERLAPIALIHDIDQSILIIRNEMADFVKLDNHSSAFRYPYSRQGNHLISESIQFNAKKLYNSVLSCRKQLTKISTELICDNINPLFKNDT